MNLMDKIEAIPANETRQHIRLRRLSSWNELETYCDQWREVLQDSQGPTIFSTSEWLGAWWRAFAKDNELSALVFFDSDNRIVGLAPLYLDWVHSFYGRRLRRLRFVGDGTHDSDNLDLIFRRGYEGPCVAALIDWLSSELEWDVCELNTMPKTSAALAFLLPRLKENGWCFWTSQTPCLRIMLPSSWDAYLNQIPRKQKTKIFYRTNKLKNRYALQIDKCTRVELLSDYLEELFVLHQKRWTLRNTAGTFAVPERRKFYIDMAASFMVRGWLEFWRLRLGNKTVAAQFCFRLCNTVYSLQEGFDPSFSADSVGFVLRAAVLKNLISEGVSGYDFLGGKDSSKQRWGAQLGEYTNVHFARPYSRGSLYINLLHGVRRSKSWLKSMHAAQALFLLRTLFHTSGHSFSVHGGEMVVKELGESSAAD